MFTFLTLATIWSAMLAWTLAILFRVRGAWTLAFVLYIVHILAAHESHYAWSHEVAYTETARQTADATGWDSGVGLYFNYAFAAILAFDLVIQWRYRSRKFPRTIDGLVFFMIFNGAVIFGSGPVRWFGVLLCTAILVGWILRARGNSSPEPSPPE